MHPFHLTYNLPPFLLSTFPNLNFFWLVFSNSFSLKLPVIGSRNCIVIFTNNKNFFWPILSVSFSKNVFVFWYPYTITNFKFRFGFIRIFIVLSIRIKCNVNWFHFYCSVNCVLGFINNILEHIKMNTLWNSCHVLQNLVFQRPNKSLSNPDFPYVEYISTLFIFKNLLKILL